MIRAHRLPQSFRVGMRPLSDLHKEALDGQRHVAGLQDIAHDG